MGHRRSYKPGEKPPTSGQYQIIGPRGQKGPEKTIVKNEPFPPTLKPGCTYIIVDRTKTKKQPKFIY